MIRREAVIALAAVTGNDQPGGFHRLVRIAGHRGQRLPIVGGITDAELHSDRPGQPAALQILDRARRILQRGAIHFGGFQHQPRQILGFLAPRLRAGRRDTRHIQADAARQIADGLGKRHPAVFDQKPIAVRGLQPKQ